MARAGPAYFQKWMLLFSLLKWTLSQSSFRFPAKLSRKDRGPPHSLPHWGHPHRRGGSRRTCPDTSPSPGIHSSHYGNSCFCTFQGFGQVYHDMCPSS